MAGYKRKASFDDASPKKSQRQKGSLNSFSCDGCKKSKIKCQPLPGSERCQACTKKGPQQPCIRTGVDNRSNDTTLAKLNAMVDTFKSIYDDYHSVFLFMWDPKAHETENMSMMLRVANPTTYLPISGKTKPHNWKYPAFCTFNCEGLRLVEIRALKDSFSHKAWNYVCKLQALLNAFISGTLTDEDRNDIGTTLFKIGNDASMFRNLVEDFEKMNQNVLLNPASVQDSPLLAEYKHKLIHEQGLDLKLKAPEPRLPLPEVIDLTEDSPQMSSSPASSTTLDAAGTSSHPSWHDSSNGVEEAILALANSMETPAPDASTSSTADAGSSQSSETILPSLEADNYTLDYFGLASELNVTPSPGTAMEQPTLFQGQSTIDQTLFNAAPQHTANTDLSAAPEQPIFERESSVLDPNIFGLDSSAPQQAVDQDYMLSEWPLPNSTIPSQVNDNNVAFLASQAQASALYPDTAFQIDVSNQAIGSEWTLPVVEESPYVRSDNPGTQANGSQPCLPVQEGAAAEGLVVSHAIEQPHLSAENTQSEPGTLQDQDQSEKDWSDEDWMADDWWKDFVEVQGN